jgi:hypothetical protein
MRDTVERDVVDREAEIRDAIKRSVVWGFREPRIIVSCSTVSRSAASRVYERNSAPALRDQ